MSRVWRTSAIQYRKKILSARHVLLYNLPSLWSANSSSKRASQDIYMFLFGRHVYHDSNVFVLVLRSMGFHSSLTFRSSICYSDDYYLCYFNYTKYKIFKLIKRKLMPLLWYCLLSSPYQAHSMIVDLPRMIRPKIIEGKNTLLPEFTMLSLS